MNDLHHPCEPWAEQISLAAAGCLAPDEERETRRHIETCSDCRERFRQLTELCGAIAEVRLPAVGTEAAIIERVMSAVASDESGQPIVRTRAEMIHPTLLTRSLTNWRWIMRSPVSRVAAAVVFVLTVTGVALWFHGGGATPAFADFAKPILEAKTAKFKITTEMEMNGQAITTTAEVMVLDAARSRQEMEMPDKSKMVMIFDWGRGKSLTLVPALKQATVLTMTNMPKGKIPIDKDPLGWLRLLLLDARDKPDVKREPLGEKDIDGRRVVGFRVNTNGMVMSLWGDPKTGLPVRAEVTMAMFTNVKMTLSDFVFNLDMDESLFSTEPPAGYTVQNMGKIDLSPAEEKDLIETFREYSKLNDGAFPDSLDMRAIIQIVAEKFVPGMVGKPNEEQMQKMAEAQKKLQRGLMFAVVLPPDADAHYAGKGVSLGAADTPIFWYRPKDANKYRVIYADLSVREAETPPSVPDAQPVPAPSSPKK
jgi:outer membrane lipoprotein-sorting protein